MDQSICATENSISPTLYDQGIDFPDDLDEIRLLAPFAVEFRYDFLDDEVEEFGVNRALELLYDLRNWVRVLIGLLFLFRLIPFWNKFARFGAQTQIVKEI